MEALAGAELRTARRPAGTTDNNFEIVA